MGSSAAQDFIPHWKWAEQLLRRQFINQLDRQEYCVFYVQWLLWVCLAAAENITDAQGWMYILKFLLSFHLGCAPPTNCANRLLLPEMLTMDVHWATTRSCKKSCLLAVSSGKCQVLISYSARKESTLLSYDIAKKRNKLLARNTDWTCQKGTKWLHNVYGYYTTWQVTINKLGLGIPPAESKGMHLMSVLTTHQGKDCWSCSTGIDSIRSLTDECFL